MSFQVEPLRNELRQLEETAQVKQREAEEMAALIDKLETSINNYKEEYAQLISQAEAIKSDLKQVQDKVRAITHPVFCFLTCDLMLGLDSSVVLLES